MSPMPVSAPLLRAIKSINHVINFQGEELCRRKDWISLQQSVRAKKNAESDRVRGVWNALEKNEESITMVIW